MTWYIARNSDGSIASVNKTHFPGYNEEALPDNDPTVIAFLSSKTPDFDAFNKYAPYALFMVIELVKDLLAKGTIVPSDFTPLTRAVFTKANALLNNAVNQAPPPP